MNVWLLHVGEELPVDTNARLFRYGHLTEALLRQGHSVVRWAPTFQHARKSHRYNEDALVEVQPGYRIQFVHAPGYQRNISLARFRSYRRLAKRFQKLSEQLEPPDLILTGIPSLDWCEAAINYSESRKVPVVVDVRDLWPDVFLTAAPRIVSPIANLALIPLRRQAARICRRATALVAVSETYLDWGLKHAGRCLRLSDGVFPIGYQALPSGNESQAARLSGLKERGVDPKKSICCFFGLFEKSYDLSTVVEAARLMARGGKSDVQFVLCGDGSNRSKLQHSSHGLDNVLLPGWIDQADIEALMSVSQIGLASYASGAMQSLPNKPFEYMAGGLAIVSSLPGELSRILDSNKCGASYVAGSARSLSEAIDGLLSNPSELKSIQKNARRLYEQNYTAVQLADQLAENLHNVGKRASLAQRKAA